MALSATLLALTTLTLGCVQEVGDELDDPSQLRGSEIEVIATNDDCVVERGDLWEAHDAVLADAVLRCPDSRIRTPEVALDEHGLWGHLDSATPNDFFIEHSESKFNFDWLDELPGDGFTGQAPDGTLYRFEENLAGYLHNEGGAWVEVPVDGLPDLFWAYNGFEVHPDSTGQLHAQFETNGYGEYQFWQASFFDDEWTWAETGDSLYGASSTRYAGPDAWDRLVSIRRANHNGITRWKLSIDGDNDQLVGNAADYPGFLADPPRPKFGGDAPLAMIQRVNLDSLAVITAVDGDDWTESPIANTPGLAKDEMCDETKGTKVPECPPCHFDAVGIEYETFRIVRTSTGPMWGVWLVSDIEVDYVYDMNQVKEDFWKCEVNFDSSSSYAETTLVVAELAVDGSIVRSAALELGTMWVDNSLDRNIAAAAFGDDIGVLIQADSGEDETVGRVLRIDTSAI